MGSAFPSIPWILMRIVWIGRIKIRVPIKRIGNGACCNQENDSEDDEETRRDEAQRSLLSRHLTAFRTSAEAEQSIGIPTVVLALFIRLALVIGVITYLEIRSTFSSRTTPMLRRRQQLIPFILSRTSSTTGIPISILVAVRVGTHHFEFAVPR